MEVSRDRLIGYAALLLSLVSWETAGATAQALQHAVPDLQLNIYRQIVTAVISATYMWASHTPLYVRREDYFKVLLMVLAEFLCSLFYYMAVEMLPLSHATGFYVGIVMIFLAVGIQVLLHKRMDLFVKLAFFGCLLGLILQSQPWKMYAAGFIPGFAEEDHMYNYSKNATELDPHVTINAASWVLIGHILLLIAAFFEAISMILVGEYLKSVKPSLLTFMSAALGLPMSIVVMFYIEQPVSVSDTHTILLVTLHCVSNGLTVLLENTSYQLLPLVHVSIVESTETIVSMAPQYTIFKKHLGGRMNALEVIGSLLIIVSLVLSSVSSLASLEEEF